VVVAIGWAGWAKSRGPPSAGPLPARPLSCYKGEEREGRGKKGLGIGRGREGWKAGGRERKGERIGKVEGGLYLDFVQEPPSS